MNKLLNLVLSGGGIKGLAYSGVFDVAERRGFRFANIGGVSAGAIAGTYLAAGFKAREIKKILKEFDFSKIEINRIERLVPAIPQYIKFYSREAEKKRYRGYDNVKSFLNQNNYTGSLRFGYNSSYRSNFFKNLHTFCTEGALCDGDYLEEWAYKTLKKRGIKTFGDLRYGIPTKYNPNAYKVRMTAVDINRVKIITLPDDLCYYGIEPDNFEVARAVRMSTAVPFVFKAVEIKYTTKKGNKKGIFVDGGVFDNFPEWLVPNYGRIKTIGFRLDGGECGLERPITALDIFIALIKSVHNIGIPYINNTGLKYANIDTSKVSFLDFSLSDEDAKYLYEQGVKSSEAFFDKYVKRSTQKNIWDRVYGFFK